MENRNEVSGKFDQIAQDYDAQRRKLIPCFDDFYQTAVSIADVNTETPRILDLGAGTGLLSSFMLQRYPKAELTLIDISGKMMDMAQARLSGYSSVHYVLDDYTHYLSEKKFDIIVSGLSIHHLTDESKLALYRNAFTNLNNNGVFINADQVLGHTEALDSLYKNDWKRKIEASGLSREQLKAAYERTKLDKMAGLQTQLNWLQEAGFSDVDCVYKYFNFVVMYGRKLPLSGEGVP